MRLTRLLSTVAVTVGLVAVAAVPTVAQVSESQEFQIAFVIQAEPDYLVLNGPHPSNRVAGARASW